MTAIALIPLAATSVVAVVTLLAHRSLSAPAAARLCVWAIGTQIVLATAAWLYPSFVPRQTNWRGAVGDTCPDLAAPTES